MPAFLAASSCVPSCEPSMAPTISTFAPFSIIALIWFCCSVTPPLANWTLGVNPAALSPSLNRPSARTQFSDVFWGSATPMTAPLAKPAALELPLAAAVSVRPPPQPDSARALTTAIAATALANFLISTSSFVRQPFWPFRFPPRPRLAGGGILCGACDGPPGPVVRVLGGSFGDGRWRLADLPCPRREQQSRDRRLVLRLLPHVEGDGREEDEALDHLGRVRAGAHELESVVEHGHDQSADDGPHDRPDAS